MIPCWAVMAPSGNAPVAPLDPLPSYLVVQLVLRAGARRSELSTVLSEPPFEPGEHEDYQERSGSMGAQRLLRRRWPCRRVGHGAKPQPVVG
jgi:hypothetical protein